MAWGRESVSGFCFPLLQKFLSQPPFLACLTLPQAMAGAGIVSGFDMTSEAALAKLSYVLGQPGLSLDDRKKVCVCHWDHHRDLEPFCVCRHAC